MSFSTVTKGDVAFFSRRLQRWYGIFLLGLFVFIAIMLGLESLGLPRNFIGYAFLILTLALYGVIGILNFTRKLDEYYVAGRKVPPFFNGMATGADWMSAASFISMAGLISFMGYAGGVYLMGWTGGFVLLILVYAVLLNRLDRRHHQEFERLTTTRAPRPRGSSSRSEASP